MVTILPSERTGLDVLGKYVGQGIQNSMPQQYENMKFQRGMSAIDQLQDSLDPKNGPVDQGKVLANLARVQAQLPGFERSPYMEHVMKLASANAMANAPRAGENRETVRGSPEMSKMPERQELPEFMGKKTIGQNKEQFFPNNQELKGRGSVPQQATTGIKEPLLNPREQIDSARELNKAQREAGLNVTLDESMKQVRENEENKKIHNAEVDRELKQRKEGEKTYGKTGVDALKKYYENAPPELETIFQKKGEEAAKGGESDADINRYLGKEAERIGNIIKNVTSKPSATRSYNKLGRAINGTYRDFNESAEDIRRDIQPLIDEGLYDFSRKLVGGLGYYPEEREVILNPLSQGVQSSFNELPKIGNYKSGNLSFRPNVDLSPLKEAITLAQNSDPNFSQVLGRKMAEDKGYDWSQYKNALNELEKEGLKLSGDQATHRGELDNPPVSFLSTFLYDLGFTGR